MSQDAVIEWLTGWVTAQDAIRASILTSPAAVEYYSDHNDARQEISNAYQHPACRQTRS